jgi:SAM-dependent methyltransferase
VNPGEHAVMARVEERHWWYRVLRDCLARVLARPDLRPPEGARVLDAGCGTGGNLRFLAARLAPAWLGGFDASDEALALARAKAAGARLWRSDICDPELPAVELDLVTSFDVVNIPGLRRATCGLHRLVSALRPGGLLILNLPGHRWLHGRHDVAVHSRERYALGDVRGLLAELDLEAVILSHRLCLMLPLVAAARLPGRLRAPPDPAQVRSDLHRTPPDAVNRALFAAIRPENALVARGVCLPFGSSIFAVGRKPAAPG